jgi:L-cystine uptake protein TcyP (sodium:dicarboxylate symporter family)
MWFLILIAFLIFIIPIVLIGITIKYIKDVRESSDCTEINSSYLTFYYYYYWIELVFMILLSVLFVSIMKSVSSLAFPKKSLNKIGRKTTPNYIHTFVCLLLLGFFIKLLVDISNEDRCKDVDPGLRTFLLITNSISMFSLVINLFSM